MKWKLLIFLTLVVFCISFVSSFNVDIPVPINYTEIIINESSNNSLYWDGNAWSDTRWLNIDGSNANQNIDIGNYLFEAFQLGVENAIYDSLGFEIIDLAMGTRTLNADNGFAMLDFSTMGLLDAMGNSFTTTGTITGEQLTSTDDITMAGVLTNTLGATDIQALRITNTPMSVNWLTGLDIDLTTDTGNTAGSMGLIGMEFDITNNKVLTGDAPIGKIFGTKTTLTNSPTLSGTYMAQTGAEGLGYTMANHVVDALTINTNEQIRGGIFTLTTQPVLNKASGTFTSTMTAFDATARFIDLGQGTQGNVAATCTGATFTGSVIKDDMDGIYTFTSATAYGGKFTGSNSGTGGTTYGGWFRAFGGTNNYGIWVEAGDVIISNDNQKILFGEGQEMSIYYGSDGHGYINPKEVGSGQLKVLGDVNATTYYGDGSQLTGISGGSSVWDNSTGTAVYNNNASIGNIDLVGEEHGSVLSRQNMYNDTIGIIVYNDSTGTRMIMGDISPYV